MIIRDWTEKLTQQQKNRKWFELRFCDLDYPELYLGDEMNTFHFDWEKAVLENRIDDTWRIVLINLITSRFTFSAPAIMLFYELLHEYDPSWIVERSLCPPTAGNRKLMKEDAIRPFAVESKMPLTAFNVICMSMDLTLSAVSVPWLLLESNIPLHAEDRKEDDPFVILGGSALVNPAPFAPFCDLLFFGEGEEILPKLLAMLKEGRNRGMSREMILLEAVCRWNCLYAPRFYKDQFDSEGHFVGTLPLNSKVPKIIQFNRIRDIDQAFQPSKPFQNFSTNVAETCHHEISRGCEGKCSFCMAGFSTLPFRPRSAKLVRETMERIIFETGNIYMMPVSFNSVSHPEINRIIRDMSELIGDKIKLVSLRMDGFHSNPELCCFISMQKRGRIAFGVEGASQRLRDRVSKNLSEEQILSTMHEVCHIGYRVVKFMMICNIPGETEADLDELYELAVKIHDIFEKETPLGKRMPKLLISWQPLKCGPHTPLQWSPISREIMPAYARFTMRIKELGFSTFTPKYTVDELMSQLFLRGDSRMSDLLVWLSEEGQLKHNPPYGDDLKEKTSRFLALHNLPPIEEWFREYRFEDPLPWDIVKSPASKEYLYRRYQEIFQKKPEPDPICSRQCSGCGACEEGQQRKLKDMEPLRKEDRKIDLHHPVLKRSFSPVQHMLLEYDYDFFHSTVIPSYWDCEIRRALFLAGVSFDPDSVESFGSSKYDEHEAAGFNVTCLSLETRYDLQQLKCLINDHAVNFSVRSLSEIPIPLRVSTVTYRMKLPEDRDPLELSSFLEQKLVEDEWNFIVPIYGVLNPNPLNLRNAVQKLEILGEDLFITMGPEFTDPRKIFRYLFQIPYEQSLSQVPERIGFTYGAF